jgi:hypothetical protein
MKWPYNLNCLSSISFIKSFFNLIFCSSCFIPNSIHSWYPCRMS